MKKHPTSRVKVPIHEQQFERCGARSKRHGGVCLQPAMKNGRCRFHGGKSTGPKTPGGREKARLAVLKHGQYTQEAIAERKHIGQVLRLTQQILKNPNILDTLDQDLLQELSRWMGHN